MPDFSAEELNLIYLYDPGNLRGLIRELRSMINVLMPDEKDLYSLAYGAIAKLETMSTVEYKKLCQSYSPEDTLLHFNLGLNLIADETEE